MNTYRNEHNELLEELDATRQAMREQQDEINQLRQVIEADEKTLLMEIAQKQVWLEDKIRMELRAINATLSEMMEGLEELA